MSATPFANTRAAIIAYFKATFVQPVDVTVQPPVAPARFMPYSLPNYRIDQPKDGTGNALPWARFTINEGRTLPREVGGGSTRIPGICYLQVFMPENTGTLVARQAADLMVNAFQYQTLVLPDGVIRFREVSFRPSLGTINGYDRSNVEIEFIRDAFAGAPLPLPVFNPAGAPPPGAPSATIGADGVLRLLNPDSGQYQSVTIQTQNGMETIALGAE